MGVPFLYARDTENKSENKSVDIFLFSAACGMMKKDEQWGFKEVLQMEEKKELTVAEQVEQEAQACFRQGLNCSECVMTAFLNHFETGLPREIVKLATGFGGGMGHTKNTCGAITGAVMALSAVVGRENPLAKETVPERVAELQKGIYPIVGKMVHEIEDEYGTLICAELSNPFGEWEGKARKKNCMSMVTYCAGLAAKYAEQAQKERKENA